MVIYCAWRISSALQYNNDDNFFVVFSFKLTAIQFNFQDDIKSHIGSTPLSDTTVQFRYYFNFQFHNL